MIRGSDNALGCIIASPNNANPSAVSSQLLRESCLGLQYQQILRPCILVGEASVDYGKAVNKFVKCQVVTSKSCLSDISKAYGSRKTVSDTTRKVNSLCRRYSWLHCSFCTFLLFSII